MFRHVKFVNLPVVDQDRALKFYTETIGLELVLDDPGQGTWRWIELAIPGADTSILLARREGAAHAEPCLVLVCDDVAAECARLEAAGVAIVISPREAPWQTGSIYACIGDSEGNTVMLDQSPK
jgi:predicted enzyme related to lactoylglutathione lyase